MNQLLVDIGNSRLKWALYDGQFGQSGAMELSVDDIVREINNQWQFPQPDQVVYCTVARKKMTNDITGWLKNKWSCPVNHVCASTQFMGVTNAYSDPAKLGADRWATLIAARKLVTGAVCVVDCGTAITVDGMDENGQHFGGVIMPGIDLQKELLKGGTAMTDWQKNTQSAELEMPIMNTTAAIEYGTSYGIAGAIDRLIVEFSRHLGDNMVVLLTGGTASEISGLLKSKVRLEKDLVLLGLALFGENEKGAS